jgi:ABC-type amino acid transport substrate-binding protein/mono/diheme cytochrome c family protein
MSRAAAGASISAAAPRARPASIRGERTARVLTLLAAGSVVALTLAPTVAAAPLRVCADPDNLPFTSSRPDERGIYLELAELIAARMETALEPVYVRDVGRRGLRTTLLAGRCDMFFGLPFTREAAGTSIRLTRPFLEIGYALVAPKTFTFRRLEDLHGTTVGVQHASTPQTLLSVRDEIRLVTFRTAEEVVDALARREIPLAFVWGPVAGYRAARLGLLTDHTIVSAAGFGLRAEAAIGVRATDQALRERLDRTILELRAAILALGEKYHIPLDRPVDLEAASALGAEGATTSPVAGDPALPTEGRTLFNVHCSHCHAPNAASPEPVRDLRRLRLRYGDRRHEVFYTTVTKGRPTKGMPPAGGVLDEAAIRKIEAFLESVQAATAD